MKNLAFALLLLLISGMYFSDSLYAQTLTQARMTIKDLKVEFWRSHPLGRHNTSLTRAIVIIHGNRQDSWVPADLASRAAHLEGVQAETLIIAPQFKLKDDDRRSDEFWWSNKGWKQGSYSGNYKLHNPRNRGNYDRNISSFDVVDTILGHIFRNFPNMQQITIAGHSAGGQYVHRYAALNKMDRTSVNTRRIPIRYVVVNPSSYMFVTAYRDYSTRNCSDYNKYRYGLIQLRDRIPYYTNLTNDQVKQHVKNREIFVVLGENDTVRDSTLDKSCEADAQGPNRYLRGLSYIKLTDRVIDSPNQRLRVIPNVGHSSRDTLQRSVTGRHALFHIENVPGDYDDDDIADLVTWTPGTRRWKIRFSGGGTRSELLSHSTDVPVPHDYNGDGVTEIAYWRPSTQEWRYITSPSGTSTSVRRTWGTSMTDTPVPGDYDGDGRADYAVWTAAGRWEIELRTAGRPTISQSWGLPSDIPVPGDYDGDGRTDIAVWRPSTQQWFHIRSTDRRRIGPRWGTSSSDVPVPADYDGDGITDYAFRSGELWSIKKSSGGYIYEPWGTRSDIPVPGDYDGDGKADIAVWRPTTKQWFYIRSSNGSRSAPTWGDSGSKPLSPSHLIR